MRSNLHLPASWTSNYDTHDFKLRVILWKKKAKENKEELIDLSIVHSSSETLCPSTRNTRLKTEQI